MLVLRHGVAVFACLELCGAKFWFSSLASDDIDQNKLVIQKKAAVSTSNQAVCWLEGMANLQYVSSLRQT